MNRCIVRLAIFLILSMTSISFTQEQTSPVIVLRAARMWDGRSSAPVQNGVVIVERGRIGEAGTGIQIPDGAKIVDLGDASNSNGTMDRRRPRLHYGPQASLPALWTAGIPACTMDRRRPRLHYGPQASLPALWTAGILPATGVSPAVRCSLLPHNVPVVLDIVLELVGFHARETCL